MKSGPLQAALLALALGVLVLVGAAITFSPEVNLEEDALPADSTIADAFTTSFPSTTTETTTTSTTPPRRDVSIVVYPSDAAAAITTVDSTGLEQQGTETLTANLSGDIDVDVEANGYRAETLTIPAQQAGEVEIYLDPPDQVVDRRMVFTTGKAPKQVAFNPDGRELWVTLLGGTGVEVYDPITGASLDSIELPEAGSVEVVFNRAGDTAYVSQMETASVYEIDVATRAVKRTLATGGSWTKVIALSPDEKTLWASNWVSNDVSEIDLTTGRLRRRIHTVTTPRGLALDPSGTKLYVAGFDAGDIEVVDLATGEAQTIYHSGGAMRHLVADPTSPLIYASDMARDQILVIHTGDDSVTTLGSTDRLPNTIDISPDGRFLAVSNRGRNNPDTYYLPGPEWGSILLLDTQDGHILDAIVGGNQPTGLDISPDGRRLAYSDFLDDRVTVLAVPTSSDLRAAGGGRAGTYEAQLEK